MTYSVRKFTQRFAIQLVQPIIDLKVRRYSLCNVEISFGVELSDLETHIRFDNEDSKSMTCYLCKFVNDNLKMQ